MYKSDLKLFNGFLFTDFKYLMAYSIPLTALIGIYFGGYWLFLTPAYIFVIIPIVERILTILGIDELETKRSEKACLLYTSPSPRDLSTSRMPSSA